jgi:hypothetical protein
LDNETALRLRDFENWFKGSSECLQNFHEENILEGIPKLTFFSNDGNSPSGLNMAALFSNWFGDGLIYQKAIELKVPIINPSIVKFVANDMKSRSNKLNVSCDSKDSPHEYDSGSGGAGYIIIYYP